MQEDKEKENLLNNQQQNASSFQKPSDANGIKMSANSRQLYSAAKDSHFQYLSNEPSKNSGLEASPIKIEEEVYTVRNETEVTNEQVQSEYPEEESKNGIRQEDFDSSEQSGEGRVLKNKRQEKARQKKQCTRR